MEPLLSVLGSGGVLRELRIGGVVAVGGVVVVVGLLGLVLGIVVWGVGAGGGTQGVLGEDEVRRRIVSEDEGGVVVVVVEGWLRGVGEEERGGRGWQGWWG